MAAVRQRQRDVEEEAEEEQQTLQEEEEIQQRGIPLAQLEVSIRIDSFFLSTPIRHIRSPRPCFFLSCRFLTAPAFARRVPFEYIGFSLPPFARRVPFEYIPFYAPHRRMALAPPISKNWPRQASTL